MTPQLILGAGLVSAFALSAALEPWHQTWAGNRAGSANILQVALGDARKLFAKQFFVQADVYLHSGFYPSMFDRQSGNEGSAVSAVIGGVSPARDGEHQEHRDLPEFLGKPKDWIDAFGRSFYPTKHLHLGDKQEAQEHPEQDGHDHAEHDPGAESGSGAAREILPWLRLSATLDPEQPQTYLVAAYWLRKVLNKPDEAERFLREGLQANPGHEEILFELGSISAEHRHDPARARNLWELALKNWRAHQAGQPETNILAGAQILGRLAKLEEEQGNRDRALLHLRELAIISPNKAAIQKWIAELEAKPSAGK